MKLNTPYKNEIIALALVLVFGLLIKQRLSQAASQMRSLAGQEQELEKRKGLVKNWEQASQEYEALAQDIFFKDLFSFARFVQDAAWEHDVDIQTLDTQRRGHDFFQEIVIILDVRCEYTNAVEFIKTLEQGKVRVQSFERGGWGRRARGRGRGQGRAIKLGVRAFILMPEEQGS